jgi:hypothetical protein
MPLLSTAATTSEADDKAFFPYYIADSSTT